MFDCLFAMAAIAITHYGYQLRFEK